jgi:hypothetical protein
MIRIVHNGYMYKVFLNQPEDWVGIKSISVIQYKKALNLGCIDT